MRAGGERREDVAAGVVGEHGEPEDGDFDAGALEEVAGGAVGDVAGERGGPKDGGGEKESEGDGAQGRPSATDRRG